MPLVRLAQDTRERAFWNRLLEVRHYLGFRCPFGAALRHVAGRRDGDWAALLGWSLGTFRVGVRDCGLGWAQERQFRHLHLIPSDMPVPVLQGFRVPN